MGAARSRARAGRATARPAPDLAVPPRFASLPRQPGYSAGAGASAGVWAAVERGRAWAQPPTQVDPDPSRAGLAVVPKGPAGGPPASGGTASIAHPVLLLLRAGTPAGLDQAVLVQFLVQPDPADPQLLGRPQ